jgi:hypothetical protein
MTRSLLCLFLFAAPLSAQSVVLTSHDGSKVRGQLAAPTVNVTTRYGNLVIPVADVLSVEFGGRLNDADRALVLLLGSERFTERDAASKRLGALGPAAYPVLHRLHAEAQDMEVQRRLKIALAALEKAHPHAKNGLPHDVIRVRGGGVIVGAIDSTSLEAESACFGKLSVKLESLASLLTTDRKAEMTVNADAKWHATGVTVLPGHRVTVTASGEVDLWPGLPGQYVTGPKGYTTHGKDTPKPAGSLLAKVGSVEVFVGDGFTWTPTAEGVLHLRIVESPWGGTPSVGGYAVTVRVE